MCGNIDSIHHHLLEVIFETATVPELMQEASMHHPLWVVVVVVYRIGFPKETTFQEVWLSQILIFEG